MSDTAYPGQVTYLDAGGFTTYRPDCGIGFCNWRGTPVRCGIDPSEQVEKSAQALMELRRHFKQFHAKHLERQGIDIDQIT